MNLLFINYGDLTSNSLNHIAPYANAFARRGHACAVVLDAPDDSPPRNAEFLFSVFTHPQVRDGANLFPDARPADLIHAWTPRENVRRLALAYRQRFPDAKLIVHLEDNEEAILESVLQKPIAALQALPDDAELWHPRLSHPRRYREFLAASDAVSLIADSLERFLPTPKPIHRFVPPLPSEPPSEPPDRDALARRYGLKPSEKLIAYPGGVTISNRPDIRSLYLAVRLLNQRGLPCRILKTGPSCPELNRSFAFPLDEICLDLGFLPRKEVDALVAASDALVQPGQDNAFNRDRFPCKIPEFLASGVPCLLPKRYDPAPDAPESLCLILQSSSPDEIAAGLERLFRDPDLAQRLGDAARRYATRRFAVEPNATALEAFYEQLLAQPRLPAATPAEPPEQADSADQIERLQAELAQARERVERLQASASWKLTQPLRALRRALVDPWRRPRRAAKPGPAPHPPQPSPRDEPAESKAELPPPGHPSYHKDYHLWLAREAEHTARYLDAYRAQTAPPGSDLLISILLPIYNIEERWLRRCLDSVLAQAHANWELCIADDASPAPHVRSVLQRYARQDARIKVLFRQSNGHISAASNSAFTLSTGPYLALLDHDDELPPHALAKVAEAIARNPQAKLLYSDEDKIDAGGWRHGPHFKSDWNPELFLGCNMISHLGVYRRDAFEAAGGFRTGFEGAQDWDLALRVTEACRPEEIVHLPEILYHWRSVPSSTAHDIASKDYATAAQKRAIAEHLARRGIPARLESIAGIHWRVRYPIPEPAPPVSIVIPTRDRAALLQACLESVLQNTDYPNFEVVLVDNDTAEPDALDFLERCRERPRVRVLSCPGPFNFAALCNRGVAESRGDIVCLLNNDIEAERADWLSELVSHAARPEIGAVGAKLLFPHRHVQHGGVILGVGGIAAHAFKFLHETDDGHVHRAKLLSEFSAVTGACLAVRRQLWDQVGGLDEKNLPVAYNDVDFCLRLKKLGYRNLVTPFAPLVHKESESRGPEGQSEAEVRRFAAETAYMQSQWRDRIENDPFYNPNFTRSKEDFSYRR